MASLASTLPSIARSMLYTGVCGPRRVVMGQRPAERVLKYKSFGPLESLGVYSIDIVRGSYSRDRTTWAA